MIIRAKRNTNYTIISNMGLEDENLSLKAKGLLAYLLSKPDNWKVSDRQLSSIGPDGRTAVQAALKELEAHGYLKRNKFRNDDGTFSWASVIYDEPRPDEPGLENPATEKPAQEKPAKISTVVASTIRTSTVKRKEDTSFEAGDEDFRMETEKFKNPKSPTPQQEMFGAICEAIGADPATLTKEDQGQIAQAMGILVKASYGIEDIRAFMIDVWFKDWRWVKHGQHPTLSQLRKEIGKIRSVVAAAAPKPQSNVDNFLELARKQGARL